MELMREKGLVYENEGALWFKTTDFGDDKDRVVVRSNGVTTYFASDIAYHIDNSSADSTGLWMCGAPITTGMCRG